jgi:hypothetical protein
MSKANRVKMGIAGVVLFVALASPAWASDPNDPNDPNNIVATPVFTPDGGTYSSEQNVIITCATSGATIRYTLDGSDPNNGTTIASGSSVFVDHSLTLKAVAQKEGMTTSAGKSATYQLVVATPVFTPDSGTYSTEQNATITCATSGATIRYTLDGSDPNNGTIIANGASVTVAVNPPTFLKAKAFKAGFTMSNIKTAVYYHYAGGSGTAQDPYQIDSSQTLLTLAADPSQYSKCFILTDDIDFNGQVFSTAIIAPDTSANDFFQGTAFTGTFNGNGYKITHFTINGGANDYLGLFGFTGSGSQIKNLGIENFSVSGSSDSYHVGGLVGTIQGSINSCYSNSIVSGSDAIGGLIGFIYLGSVSNSYSTGTVSGDIHVGGLVGQSFSQVSNCYSTGFVSGSSYVGGLVGYIWGGVAQNSFWDTQTSGRTTSASGTGKTTAQMKMLSTFTSAGWDFSDTDGDPADWFFPTPADYPVLFWESFLDPNTVAPPMFSVAGGTYNTEQNVTITCATAGATIHYTTTGVDPTESDPVIASGGSVYVDHGLTLKARAWNGSMTPSRVKSATYQLIVADPNFAPGGGTYNTEQNVIITCTTSGATIHYTTTGVDPTESDPVVASGSSVTVDRTMTLKAKAWKGNMTPSGVKSAAYTLVVATPTFSKSGGTYNTEQTATITCATPGATIRYTLDGSDPNGGIAYDPNTPIYVDHTLTLKAKAWKGNMTPSGVKSAAYTLVVLTPTFSKSGGTYNTEQTVTITCATPGATIRYTLD